MITLQMLVREETSHSDEGEDDGIAQTAHQEAVETTVATDHIRNVHPRKYGKSGTRVVFKNGSALIVTNLYADVVQAWRTDVGELSAEDPV